MIQRPSPAVRGRWRWRVFVGTGSFVSVILAGFLVAAPAFADQVGTFYTPRPLSLAAIIGLFIGIPVAGFVFSGLLAYGPRTSKRRYRPGKPWPYEAEWFGDTSAIEQEPTRAALPGAGGASGRW